jgi:ferredoxin
MEYSKQRFPDECAKYYQQIEALLFNSGLIDQIESDEKMLSKEEKLDRHGFVHWRRRKEQEQVGAVKTKQGSDSISYIIRNPEWIAEKHLEPLKGKWIRKGNEICFFDVAEEAADTVIKRMINCIDCGFCSMQCMQSRIFDRTQKRLEVRGCTQCGKCLSLKHCMGWQHRFWRRVIRNKIGMRSSHELN